MTDHQPQDAREKLALSAREIDELMTIRRTHHEMCQRMQVSIDRLGLRDTAQYPGETIDDTILRALDAANATIAEQNATLAAIANRAANVHLDEDDPLVVIQDIATMARGETPG